MAWAFWGSHSLAAQTQPKGSLTYEFRGEPLDEVLDRIARDTETDLVYDPELVKGIEIYKRVRNETVQGLLSSILSDHNLDYLTLSTGTVVIIRMAGESPGYGTLSGTIVDSQSGEPLPGATILLAEASGGTSAGLAGQFSINRMITGEHTIIISFVGYQAVTKTIRIEADRQISERIELAPKPVQIAPLVVEGHRPQITGYHSKTPESAGVLYRWQGDPVHDLNLIPGIQSGLPMNDITLQGGQQSEHRILLDGAPVYYPYSIGNMFSSFSPEAIGSVSLHRSGFDAAQGSQVSGIISMKHEIPAAGEYSGSLQVDPMSVNIHGNASHEFTNESSISIMTSIRTQIWDFYRDPVMEETLKNWNVIDPLIINNSTDFEGDAELYTPSNHESDLSYYDLHSALRFTPDRLNTFTFSVYASGSGLETAALSRSVPGSSTHPFLFSSESYSWKNRVGQLSYNSLLTPRTDFDAQVSYSSSSFRHASEIGFGVPDVFESASGVRSEMAFDGDIASIQLPETIDGNQIRHYIAKTGLTYSINSSADLSGGIRYDRVLSEVDFGERAYRETFSDVQSGMFSTYLSGSFRFGTYWHITGGNRLTLTGQNGSVYAEPRFSVQLDRPETNIGYSSVKISGGLYRQFVNEYRVSNTGAAAVVPSFSVWSHAGTGGVPKAYHLNGSWHLEPSDVASVRIEGYYKWQPVTQITSYNRLADPEIPDRADVGPFAESTDMKATGAGIRAEHSFFYSRLNILAGYDYSYTRLNLESQFGKTMQAPWSDPHRGLIRASFHLLSDLTLMGRWQGAWGRKWAFRDSYYNYLQAADLVRFQDFDFSSPDDDRLRSFSQVDLSVLYRPEIGSANLLLRLDFINILNRRNEIDHRLTPVFNESGVSGYEIARRIMPGFYPKFSLKVSL